MTKITLPITISEMVEEYVTTANQPVNEDMAAKLVTEEYGEWADEAYPEQLFRDRPDKDKLELKELADLIYVCYGRARAKGWDLDKAVERVHENNMGRMFQPDGTIQFREDGKVMKNKDCPKVYLGDLV